MITRAWILAFLLQLVPVQAPEPELAPPDQRLSLDVHIVNVLFTVSDSKGRFVKSLPKERFRVFEDDRQQPITQFSNDTDLPLTVALMIDTSGSVSNKLVFERQAAIEFLKSTLRPGKDKSLLYTFDTHVDLLQDFTDDVGAMAHAAEKIRAGGSTALFEAVSVASQKLANQTGRHIIILISDGNDTFSRKSIDDALRSAQQSDTAIYCVSTNSILKNSYQETDKGNKTLRRLAEETGGRIFLPMTTDELPANFRKIDEELRSQYALSFHPVAKQDSAFHKIRIEANNRQLHVKSRNGYFAVKSN